MNPHLQVILNTIQQDKNLTAEQKAAITQSLQDADKEWEITAFKLDRTEKIKKTTAILLEETIEELEQKRKAVEAQNRELEIEAALERVRSRSMAMHKTDELLDAAELVSKELSALGIESMNVSYAFVDEEEKYASYYSLNPVDGKIPPFPFVFPHHETDVMRSILSSWKKQEPFHEIELDEEATLKHQTWVGEHIQQLITKNNIDIPFSVEAFLSISPKKAVIYTFNFKQGYLFNIGGERLTREQEAMLMRFTKVFEMTYRRFLDLKQAEAQSREAQIELALERVRARTMAMQKSNELQQVVHTVFERLKELNVDFYTSIIILFTEGSKDIVWWFENRANQQYAQILIPYAHINYLRDLFEAKEAGSGFFSKYYPFHEKNELFHYLFNNTVLKNVPEQQKKFLLESESAMMSVAIATNTGIHLTSYSRKSFSEQENEILKRFAKVFDQAYTRFLDLQKAEAQAREAQIELGLERVRARAMAMQKSDELKELIGTVFTELTKLDLVLTRCVIMIYNSEANDTKWWMANSEDPNNPAGFFIKNHDHPPIAAYFKAWRERQLKWTYALEGQIKKDWDVFLFNETELRTLPGFVIEGMKAPGLVYLNASFNNFGNLTLASLEPLSEEHFDILLRFAKVFDLTYTRFNDLKQAEAQAREAQIQLALERVRARTMAMQKSEELLETSFVLFQQLRELGEDSDQTNIGIFDEDHSEMILYATTHGSQWTRGAKIELTKHRVYQQMYAGWKNNLKSIVLDIGGKELEALNKFKLENPDYQVWSADDLPKDRWIVHNAYFSKGTIAICTTTPRSDESIQLFERFAQVFDHTYTRFLDLQKAEAQAKEAQIEAALEKVRARTMGMQRSDELPQAANLLFQQIQSLGMPAWSAGYCIWDEDKKGITLWMSSEGVLQPPFKAPLTEDPSFIHMRERHERGETFYAEEIGGEELVTHYKYMRTLPVVGDILDSIIEAGHPLPAFQIFHVAYFSQGFLLFITYEPVPEAHDIFKRFGKVFDQTYTRFLDLQKAEAQAKEAKIEAALERIRNRTLLMKESKELSEAAVILFQQFEALGLLPPHARTYFNVINENDLTAEVWMTEADGSMRPGSFKMPLTTSQALENLFAAWKRKEPVHIRDLSGESLNEYINVLRNIPSLREDKSYQQLFLSTPARRVISEAIFLQGTIGIISDQHVSSETLDILVRFAKAFEFIYTRFLDLQKAEAQAREARIEAALERVRARAMAMQNSDELGDLVTILFDELTKLDMILARCIIWIFDNNNFSSRVWMANSEDKKSVQSYFIKRLQHPYYEAIIQGWQKRVQKWVYDLEGMEKKSIDELLLNETELAGLPDLVKNGIRSSEHTIVSGSFNNFGLIEASGPNALTGEQMEILSRFAKVFDLTYTRFNDLQQAEAQAREAKIETGLERVRARTMAMHSSDDVSAATATMFTELERLGIENVRCGIANIRSDQTMEVWSVNNPSSGTFVKGAGFFDMANTPFWQHLYQNWTEKKDFSYYYLSGQEKEDYVKTLNATPNYFSQPIADFPDMHIQCYYFNEGTVWTFSLQPHSDENKQVMKRFASVFSLTFRRYQDLKNAEAQAREAQIEAALERVRSKTMAMQNSRDVTSATETMFEELAKLGLDNLRCGIANIHLNRTFDVFGVTNLAGGTTMSGFGLFGMDEHPVWQRWFESWKNKEEVFIAFLAGQEKEEYFNNINNHRDYLPQKIVQFPDNFFQAYYFEQGSVWTYSLLQHTEPEKEIMKRFATGFSLTFRRYQDLKQSEAQAREAKIEAALERVRARAMAMHKSDDLEMAVATVFEELDKLNLGLIRCGIAILDKKKPRGDIWITIKSEQGNTLQVSGDEPLDIHPLLQGAWDAWKKREDFSYVLKEEDLSSYYQAITKTNFQQPITTSFHAEKTGEQQYYFNAVFQDGSLFAFLNAGFTDEARMVMKRFANVFDLTYKRFLDLQKAEAQAREAKIEAALERVRGNAMAMHNSKDLAATIGVFYRELETFSITPRRCGVGLLNKENRTAELSTMNTTEQGDSLEIIGTLNMQGHPVLEAVYDNWLLQKEYHPVLRGNEIPEYYRLLRPQISFPDYPNDAVQYGYFFFFSEGGVYAWTEKEMTDDELQIYRRFTTVLSLTYKRYIDLKQAEANAKEAIKQAALDRIRADIASMRTVSDLDRITPLVWNELTILGIPFIRCGVFIMDERQQLIHTFLSTPDGKAIAAFHLPYNTPGNLGVVIRHWQNNQGYIDHWDESSFTELAGILVKQKAIESPEQYLDTIPRGGFFLHFLPFLQGMLYVGNVSQLEEEQINLIQSVADAFSTAYARYEDFTKLEAAKQQVEKTLVDLKQAQTQLVQSEKMASLGELTAGIAHEIQNPLNFVNNFSEVSNELLDEMKDELVNNNKKDALAIADDVKKNLEKILHHGKRADAIVKGMLQHSRTSSGQKELTDINILADEYLRLAFHGLRAKDKTFNAKFETDLDSSLEKINVIPQDIGRVILNLINNAFYAVSEKRKQNLNGYQPSVTVTTKKSGDRTLIIVRDNGNGIQQHLIDKIFQPFFTTKPTGQGTGLGLSLSYDIIKAHGGEIKVETKENEGTIFTIQL